MKNLLIAATALSLFTISCNGKKTTAVDQAQDTVITKTDSTLVATPAAHENIITKNVGHYPKDFKLFDDPMIGARIKTLAASNYSNIVKNFNVETPVVEESGIYKITGCKEHDCPAFQTTVLYDATNDNINLIISENGKITALKEKGEIPYSASLKSK